MADMDNLAQLVTAITRLAQLVRHLASQTTVALVTDAMVRLAGLEIVVTAILANYAMVIQAVRTATHLATTGRQANVQHATLHLMTQQLVELV